MFGPWQRPEPQPPAHPPDCTCEDCRRIELDRVASWRLLVLIQAGYPPALAEELAFSDVDLHEATSFVLERGCPPGLAARILL